MSSPTKRSSQGRSWRGGEWTLLSYDPSYWTSAPEQLDKRAEKCGDGSWASVFADGKVVATWIKK